jgi:hypothetical protein
LTTGRQAAVPQRFCRRLHFVRRTRRHGWCSRSDGRRLNSNLWCIALRAEGSTVFYLGAALGTGMLHWIKLSAGKREMQLSHPQLQLSLAGVYLCPESVPLYVILAGCFVE